MTKNIFPEAVSVLFVDSAVDSYLQFLTGAKPDIKTHLLDLKEDGVDQITRILQNHYSEKLVQAIHIVSHGSPGTLYLGNTELSLGTLDRYTEELQTWFTPSRSSKSEVRSQKSRILTHPPIPPSTPQLLLYGCNVAIGDAGEEFITQLHHLTGAEIAGSTTPIGNATKGGNWQLDYKTGSIQPTIPFSSQSLTTYRGLLAPPEISDSATATRATDEDMALSITGITVADEDDDILTVTLGATSGILSLATTSGLSSISGNGTSNISFSGSVASVNAAINGLSYDPNQDFSGNATLAISVNDGDGPVTLNVPLAVTPVNDAPAIAPASLTVVEGQIASFIPQVDGSSDNFNITDIDNDPVQIILKVDSLPSQGTLRLNGSRLVIGSTFDYTQIGSLTYEHDGTQVINPAGITLNDFTVTVDDGAGGLIAPTVIPITVTPANQDSIVGGSTVLFEGEVDHVVPISIADPDQTGLFDVEILTLPTDGILNFNGAPVTIGQIISSSEFDAGNVTFTHDGNDANFGNPPNVSFNVRATDDGGGTGVPSSVDGTIDLIITPNNDDPTLVNNTGLTFDTVADGGPTQTITFNQLRVTDPDSPIPQLSYTLTEIPDPTKGTLILSGQSLGVGSAFTQADIDSGRLEYEFVDNTNTGTVTDLFRFEVRDGEIREYPSIHDGGIYPDDTSTTLSELTFNITVTGPGSGNGVTPAPGNSAPTPEIVDGIEAFELNEGGTFTITDEAHLRYSDSDNTPEQIVYSITQTPTSGTIRVNGVDIGRFGSFTQQDINDNNVEFVHAGNEDFIRPLAN